MYPIIDRQELAKGNMVLITVEAPQIAQKIKPGQFVVLRINETGERIPLTVAYTDLSHGTITIIFMVIGKSTALLGSLKVGDAIEDLAGPMGVTEEFAKLGTIVGIGGGSGIAVLHHLLQGYQARRQQTDWHHRRQRTGPADPGGRDEDPLPATDRRHRRRQLWHARFGDRRPEDVGGAGPSRADRPGGGGGAAGDDALGLPDDQIIQSEDSGQSKPGDGGCHRDVRACRVTVGGKTRFACVDGPHFDGHLVDFDELIQRNNMYSPGREDLAALFHQSQMMR